LRIYFLKEKEEITRERERERERGREEEEDRITYRKRCYLFLRALRDEYENYGINSDRATSTRTRY